MVNNTIIVPEVVGGDLKNHFRNYTPKQFNKRVRNKLVRIR